MRSRLYLTARLDCSKGSLTDVFSSRLLRESRVRRGNEAWRSPRRPTPPLHRPSSWKGASMVKVSAARTNPGWRGRSLPAFGLMLALLLALGTALAQQYNEAPMLAEMVAAGELPPVEERLPVNPLVIEPF